MRSSVVFSCDPGDRSCSNSMSGPRSLECRRVVASLLPFGQPVSVVDLGRRRFGAGGSTPASSEPPDRASSRPVRKRSRATDTPKRHSRVLFFTTTRRHPARPRAAHPTRPGPPAFASRDRPQASTALRRTRSDRNQLSGNRTGPRPRTSSAPRSRMPKTVSIQLPPSMEPEFIRRPASPPSVSRRAGSHWCRPVFRGSWQGSVRPVPCRCRWLSWFAPVPARSGRRRTKTRILAWR